MKRCGVLFLIPLILSIYSINAYALGSIDYASILRSPYKNTAKNEVQINSGEYNYANYTDPYLGQQWAYFTVGANLAHAKGINGTNLTNPDNPIVVAILDTGVDYNHSDLAANYLSGGYDFVNNDNDPMDDNGHGTHCAGIIAAVANNSIGICGIAPCAKIMAYKILDRTGSAYINDFTRNLSLAINHILTYHNPKYNTTHGVDVISMSVGAFFMYEPYYTELKNNISAAVSAGITVLAAAGNYGIGFVCVPAAISDVIAISATDLLQKRASYSSYGTEIDYAAPGGDYTTGFLFFSISIGILSTYLGNSYKEMMGTSMATPMAAGVVALLLGNGTRPSEIRNNLTALAKDLGSPGWDQYYGYGLVQIIPNSWDYNAWFHKNYDDDILNIQISFLVSFFWDTLFPPNLITPIIVGSSIAGGVIVIIIIAVHKSKSKSGF